MKFPKELGLGSDVMARQVRCVYGTRDGGKGWEDSYTQALERSGCTTVMAYPCVLITKSETLKIVVHGHGFTALGTGAHFGLV